MANEAEIEKARIDEWRAKNPYADRALDIVDDPEETNTVDSQVLALAVLALVYELHVGTLQITF